MEKKFFRCTICNDIHFGMSGPEVCPTCKAEKSYLQTDEEEALHILKP